MKTYIFDYISDLTDNYHSGGGLVIIADNKEDAKELYASKNFDVEFYDEWWDDLSMEYECLAEEKNVFIFPDAGCC